MSHLVAHYGYLAVVVVLALEAFGIPIPGETILVAAGAYAGTHHSMSVWLIWVFATAAVMAGAVGGYWVGWFGGYRLLVRYGRYIRMNEPEIKVGRYVFDRYGGLVVSLGRFVAVLRTYAAFLAGTNRMRYHAFVVFTLAGAVAWCGAWSLASFYAGQSLEHASKSVDLIVGAVAAVLVIAFILFVRHHAKRLEAIAEQAYPGPLDA